MFCTKCGNQLPDGSRFCPKCGNRVSDRPEEAVVQEPKAEKSHFSGANAEENRSSETNVEKKKRKKWPWILVAILLLCLLAGGLFFGNRALTQRRAEEQLSLGERYLEELDYEAAIAAFEEAISIDPKMSEAYLGLAEAYLGLGDTDMALQILEEGYARTQDDEIQERLEELQEELAQAEEEADEGASDQEEAGEVQEEQASVTQEPVDIVVRQVDNSQFPEVTFYASVSDENGETVSGLTKEDFEIREIDEQGNVKDAQISDIYQVMSADQVSLNLVVDTSSSMSSSNKIGQAQNAASSFLEKVNFERGDMIEIITFDDFVYLEQEFSNDYEALNRTIDEITLGGSTALLDAIYAGLTQTYYASGAKCVIAFTDGEENASSYTFNDVVELAKTTGIPVFIIGIGSGYGYSDLEELAKQCSGAYYSADESDLETILEEIYTQIYEAQQDYYVFRYTSPDPDSEGKREISLTTSQQASISGQYQREYVPVAELNAGFSADYADQDFIIADSSTRQLTEADLRGMSLAQLRIARNEIFARHGRLFKDVMLNKWFYSKTWYLDLEEKYLADTFDALRPSPLSDLEIENTETIRAYEEAMIASQDIFPDASNTVLSEYDLCLSKDVLKRALEQMQGYNNTEVLQQNMQLVQAAIDQEEVSY